MLKLDIDNYRARSALYLEKLFFGIPLPFFYRKSSSGKGLHIQAPQCEKWDYRRFIFDDPMRIFFDQVRERKEIPISNLLWDQKKGRKAGSWNMIESQKDISELLDSMFTENYISS